MKLKIKIIGKGGMILVLCLLCAVFIMLMTNAMNPVQKRETLAEFLPETKPSDTASQSPSVSIQINNTSALTRSNEANVLGGAGGTRKEDPQYSYFSRGWNIDDQWWELSGLSTAGYERIELSFAVRGSNTGPKNFTIEYSENGNEWQPLTDTSGAIIKYEVDSDNRFHRLGPYQLTTEVSGLEQLHIRFLNTDTESVIGEATKSSGTNYLADILITGIPKSE